MCGHRAKPMKNDVTFTNLENTMSMFYIHTAVILYKVNLRGVCPVEISRVHCTYWMARYAEHNYNISHFRPVFNASNYPLKYVYRSEQTR